MQSTYLIVAAVNGLPLVVLEEAEISRMDGNLAMQLLGLWGAGLGSNWPELSAAKRAEDALMDMR